MDKYIPADQRQRGIELARQMKRRSDGPIMASEVAGGSGARRPGIATIDLPPSSGPGATYPPPGAQAAKGKPPVVVVAPPPTRYVPRPIAAPPSPPQPAPPRVAVQPKPVPVATGGWRIQLGAFGDPNNAHKLWSQVAGRFPGRPPSFVKAGALTRCWSGRMRRRAKRLQRAARSSRACR